MNTQKSNGEVALRPAITNQFITKDGEVIVSAEMLRFLDSHMDWKRVKMHLVYTLKSYSALALLIKYMDPDIAEDLDNDALIPTSKESLEIITFLSDLIELT